MSALKIAYRSNEARYKFMGTTALVNAYAEELGDDAKGAYAAVPSEGTLEFLEVTDTPVRGMIYMEDIDALYAIFPSAVYKITFENETAAATRIGSIPGSDKVQIVRNQKSTPQIGVLCSAGVFVIESDGIVKVDDEDLPTVASIAQLGGYTIYGIEDGRFFISSINEMREVDGTDFATAEQAPDKLIRVWADRGELFIMSQRTIEPWRNTGNVDFPFEPLIGSTVPRGILAKSSVASLDNSFAWVGENGIVYRMEGYRPVRISTHEIERDIQDLEDQSDITAFSWSRGGHEFYAITGGTAWTWVYDAATKAWHSRESHREEHWRHLFTVSAWNRVIVGDHHSGTLYYFDRETHTEAGDPMIWTVRLPTMHIFPNGGVVDALHFDVATGVGVLTEGATGHDPKMMLRVYKDGGYTIVFERHLSLGKRGNYRRSVKSRRLGKVGPQGMVIEVAISDPVARSIVLADAKVRPLRLQ